MKKRSIIIGVAVLLLPVISFFGYFIYKFKLLEDRHIRLVDGQVDNIRLINLGNGDREYIANVIREVSSCDPTVIALDIFFETYDSTTVDTLLSNSIVTSNTILATRYKMGTAYAVHPKYLEVASGYGYAELEIIKGYVSHFNVSEKEYKNEYERNHGAKKIFYFAYKIAHAVDSIAATKYLKEIPQSRIPVVISRLTDQFKIYDYKELNFPCADLRGKIVYLGYLGPTNEDKHKTYARYQTEEDFETNEPDMYGSVIVANQILMILEGIH